MSNYFVNIMAGGSWVRDHKKEGYETIEAATKRLDKLDSQQRQAQIVDAGGVAVRDTYVESGLEAKMAAWTDDVHAKYPGMFL
jgi:hypothetical protein